MTLTKVEMISKLTEMMELNKKTATESVEQISELSGKRVEKKYRPVCD